jgi:hypothetical protein
MFSIINVACARKNTGSVFRLATVPGDGAPCTVTG